MKIYTTIIAAMFGLLMMAMPNLASAEIVVRPVHPVVVQAGGRAAPVHDHRVLSAVGMRQPLLPPSPLVEMPLTDCVARRGQPNADAGGVDDTARIFSETQNLSSDRALDNTVGRNLFLRFCICSFFRDGIDGFFVRG